MDKSPELMSKEELINELKSVRSLLSDSVGRDKYNVLLQKVQIQIDQHLDMMNILAGGIAHDFNDMMIPLVAYTEAAMLELSRHHPARTNLEEVMKWGDRARNLINQIFIFCQQDYIETFPVEISKVIEDDLRLLRGSVSDNIQIIDHIQSSLYIQANTFQIHQIMMNLSQYAIQSIDRNKGEIVYELKSVPMNSEIEQGDKSMHRIRLRISDTGPGLDEESLERIYDPYYKSDTLQKSAGLELSIVNNIVTAIGGKIKVSSELGQGNIFTIYLPGIDHPITMKPKDVLKYMGSGRILFVDNDIIMIKISQMLLPTLGYEITAMTDIKKARNQIKLKGQKYDLVMIEINQDGVESMNFVRDLLKLYPDMKMIFITELVSAAEIKEYKALGMSGHLIKPYKSMDIAQVIHRVLQPKKE